MEKTVEIERSIIKKYKKPIWHRFIGGCKDYRLVNAGDRIAVCISGGKDSFLLAKCMQQLQKHSDVPFELEFLCMDPGYRPENRTDGRNVHKYLKELVAAGGIDGMVTVGEMSSTTLENCIGYTAAGNHELSMCFNFHHLKVDYKNGDKWALMPADHLALKKLFQTWQEGMQAHDGWNALFWCNHDQPRAVSRFGSDTAYWKESAEMLAVAIHFMRGTPYIYQGEELGMTNPHFTKIEQYRDVESRNYYRILREQDKTEAETLDIIAQRSRDDSRTPMQWDASENAGFTTGTPWIGIADNYKAINAAAQMNAPDSIRSFYKTLVALRKKMPVISAGKIEFLYPDNADLLAYRRYDGETELLVLCNLREREIAKPLPVGWTDAEKLLGNYPDTADTLRPYECVVLKK